MLECEFCHGIFARKSALAHHIKTAKYCLDIRGEKVDHVCVSCGRNMSDKRQLERHQEKCSIAKKVEDYKIELNNLQKINTEHEKTIAVLQEKLKQSEQSKLELRQTNQDLQNQIKDIAVQGVKKSTTTNILKLESLTDEWLHKQAMLLTNEHLSQGVAGLAQFAVDNSFKDRVVCTDQSRKSLKYKENGKIIKDPKGKTLAKKFFSSIKSKTDNIIPEMIEKIKEELDNAGEEHEVFEMVKSKMEELISVEKGIKTITKGQEHELKEEFTRQMCELLPNP